MAIVFDEVTGEIEPGARAAESPAAAPGPDREAADAGADALRQALAHRERLLARLSAD
jgi:hypothetical protein